VPFAASGARISSVKLLLRLALTLVADGLLEVCPPCSPRADLWPRPRAESAGWYHSALHERADYHRCSTRSPSQPVGHNWLSKGANCPFIGQGAPCKVTHTISNGKLVYQA